MLKKLSFLPLLFAALACATFFPPLPDLTWDSSSDAVVFRLYDCCGLSPELVYENYIPDALIFGDGRIIWTSYEGLGRSVFVGQLTETEMRGLLEEFTNKGFFGWDAQYANYDVYDYSNKCLYVNLTTVSKSVCEYFEGAPMAFHQLYSLVSHGAGATGQPYLPTLGYLTAYDYGNIGVGQENLPVWPREVIGFTLADAVGGVWLEGEALAQAWGLVNMNWIGESVQEEGITYGLAIKIPELGMIDPPEGEAQNPK